jgi:hypothetical protein
MHSMRHTPNPRQPAGGDPQPRYPNVLVNLYGESLDDLEERDRRRAERRRRLWRRVRRLGRR